MASIKKIKIILVCLVCFFMNFLYHTRLSIAPVCIVLYFIAWIAEGDLKNKIIEWGKNKFALLFCGLFMLYVLGMLYTIDRQFGWFNLQVKLSMFLFPLLFVSDGVADFRTQKKICGAFLLGCVANGLICIGYALWLLYSRGEYQFLYMQFSLFAHPSYYSMYIDLAFVLIFYGLTDKTGNVSRTERVIMYCSLFFLIFLVILLQSKTGMLVSGLLLLFLLVRFIMKKRNYLESLYILAGTMFILLLTFHLISSHNVSRISNLQSFIVNTKHDSTSKESVQARYYIWGAALNVIKEHPLTGVGTGDAKAALMHEYSKRNMTGAINEQLNAHNQYLQTAICLGIPGLFYFLVCLGIPFFISVREKRLVYALFLVINGINFLTESALETQGGTIFYGFFNSLFMFNLII